MAVQVDEARDNDGAGGYLAHRIVGRVGQGIEIIAVASKTNSVAIDGEHTIGDFETIGDQGSEQGIARGSHVPSLEERTRSVTDSAQ